LEHSTEDEHVSDCEGKGGVRGGEAAVEGGPEPYDLGGEERRRRRMQLLSVHVDEDGTAGGNGWGVRNEEGEEEVERQDSGGSWGRGGGTEQSHLEAAATSLSM
jgi:hypothetical protein